MNPDCFFFLQNSRLQFFIYFFCCLFLVQVLIKPKPVYQAAVVSEQTRQLVSEALQQVTRSIDAGHASAQDGAAKDECAAAVAETAGSAGEMAHGRRGRRRGKVLALAGWLAECGLRLIPLAETQAMLHVLSSREQEWTEQEVSVESAPTIIYQEVTAAESQSATSTIKALLELQQTSGKI